MSSTQVQTSVARVAASAGYLIAWLGMGALLAVTAPASTPISAPTRSTPEATILGESDPARAWILLPTDHAALGSIGSTLSRLKRNSAIARAEHLFSETERQWLATRGFALLAAAIRIEGRQSLTQKTVENGIGLPSGLSIEPDRAIRPAGDPLEALQWGFKNRGLPQGIPFDDYTTLPIPGIPGEDLGLDRLPEPVRSKPGAPVKVAVLDTGIDWEHPEFAGRLAKSEPECEAFRQYSACTADVDKKHKKNTPSYRDELAKCDARFASIDHDGNGYPLDCLGWNATGPKNTKLDLKGDAKTQDTIGHGTHVAGVIAAALNGRGITGIAQNARILPVKVVDTSPNNPIKPQSLDPKQVELPSPLEKDLRISLTAFTETVARGMLYALRSGARVVNLSLAWPANADSALMRQLVQLARSMDVTVVAAAGNDSNDSRVLPCRYEGVICVGAHGPDGAYSYFSNYGSFVDLLAPGTRILSTWPMSSRQEMYTERKGYEFKNGTSMAAPAVAGAVARLLGLGIPADEAYARLLAGARPTRSSALRPDSLAFKSSRSGNLDLERALSLAPMPLILPADKAMKTLAWDRTLTRLPLSFRLRNFWADSPSVTVHARLARHDASIDRRSSGEDPTLGASLGTSSWSVIDWARAETRAFETEIEITSTDLEGRLALVLTIEAQGAPRREALIPIEVSIAVNPALALPGLKTLPLASGNIPAGATLRTIKNRVPGPQDYLAFERLPQQWGMTLIRESADGDAYGASQRKVIDSGTATFLEIQKLDVDFDGTLEYVVISQSPPKSGKPAPSIRFDTYTADLTLVESVEHDGSTGRLWEETLTWIRVGDRLRPSWVGLGTLPASELPPYDPWEPDYVDLPRIHFYYLDARGTHTATEPDDASVVQVLVPSEAERRAGTARVLLTRGETYQQEFSIGVIRDGKIESERVIEAPRFRQLLGMGAPQPILPLQPASRTGLSHRATGAIFASPAMPGTLRATALVDADDRTRMSHELVRPPAITESVRRLIGTYSRSPDSPEPSAVFAESHFEMVFRDLLTGEEATTSLGRFSYIPAAMFGKIFTPAVAQSASGRRLPAILIPADLGDWEGAEVIVPSYDPADGTLRALSRPAKFRLKPATGCEALGNPIEARADLPSQIVFFCRDRFVRVPLLP